MKTPTAIRVLRATLAIISASFIFHSTLAGASAVLWGIGDTFAGSAARRLDKDVALGLRSIWYQSPGDMTWMRNYKNASNTTVPDTYAAGQGIQLIVWLANHRDYAISAQFQADIAELADIFKGVGPLYIVLFTELETYPPSDATAAETYKTALSDAFISAATAAHAANSNAYVGLGFGGYSWPVGANGTRNLDRWAAAIAASDFTCTQQMQSYKHWDELLGKLRNSVRQLGAYGKPVMISHFKIWSGGENDSDPLDKKITDAKTAFNQFMADVFTDASLDALVASGLWAWVWMDDFYIRDNTHVPDPANLGIAALDNTAYTTARTFIAAHNKTDPALPASTPAAGAVLASWNFDSLAAADTGPFAASGTDASITVGSLANFSGKISFAAYTETETSTGQTVSAIREYGQPAPHIGPAQNEGGARTNNTYMSFTVTPAVGGTLSLTKLAFDIQGHTGATPSTNANQLYSVQVCTSKGGWTAADKLGATHTVTTTGAANSYSGWSTKEVDLSSLTFAADEPAEIRLYFWRDTAGNVADRTNRFIELDNLKLYGLSDNVEPPPENLPPSITAAPTPQVIAANASTGPLTVEITDPDSVLSALSLAAISSNEELVPNLNTDALAVVGSGTSWTVTVTPVADKSGVTNITLIATDGEKSATANFTVTVVKAGEPLPLVTYAFDDQAAGADTSATTFTPTLVSGIATASALGQGSGVSFVVSATLGNPAPCIWDTTQPAGVDKNSEANALANDEYLTFTVTPAAGQSLNLDTLTFDLRAREYNVNFDLTACAALYTSIGGFTSGNRVAATATVTAPGNGSNATAAGEWANVTIDLSALTPAVDEPVELRLYLWRTTTATAGFENRFIDIDNIVLNGSASVAPNAPPTISAIADKTIAASEGAATVAFVVNDIETPPAALILSATSGNATLVPNTAAALAFAGTGTDRTLTITPAAGETGTANITITVTDDDATPASATRTFALTVNPGRPQPDFTSPDIDPVTYTIGVSGTFTVTATGTPPPTFSATGLPNGLAIDPATGVISGTPTESGTFTVTVTATNTNGADEQTLTITVEADTTPLLVTYAFDDSTFDPAIATGASVTATPVANNTGSITFVTFTDDNDLAGGAPCKGIREHSQGPDHINGTTQAAGYTNTDYITFTITPATGHTLALDKLTFEIQGATGAAPSNDVPLTYSVQVTSNKTGYAAASGLGAIATALTTGAANTHSGWTTCTIDLGALTFTDDEPITFRLYCWRDNASVSERSNRWVELDNIKLYGSTIAPQNMRPTISAIANQAVAANASTGPIAFTIADAETPAAALTLSGTSSNPALVPNDGSAITFGGTGENRTVTITPAAGQGGVANITITVTDGDGLTGATTFSLTVVNPGQPLSLLTYTFENATTPLAPDTTVNLTATPVSGGGFSAGVSGQTGPSTVISAAQASGGNDSSPKSKTEAAALTASNYLTFTVNPLDDQCLDLQTLTFRFMGCVNPTANYNTTFYVAVYNSLDGFAIGHRLGAPASAATTGVPNSGNQAYYPTAWTPVSIDLTALKPAVNQPVEFRIYLWVETTATGGYTKRIISIDDISITGLLETTAPAAPLTDDATNITDIGFTAHWTAAHRAVWYTIDIATDPAFTPASLVPGFDRADAGRGTSAAITGLTPETTYYYRITAHNNAGATTSADAKSLTTLKYNPIPSISAIDDLSIIAGDGTTGPIPFTAADLDSNNNNADAALVPSATSDNPALVPNDGSAFHFAVSAQAPSQRTLTINPVASQTGTARITVTVTDELGATASTAFTLTVLPGNRWPDFTSTPNAIFTTNVPSSFATKVTGLPPVTFSAENLPDGLTIDPDTGVISGTLTRAGSYTFTVIAENEYSTTPTRQTFTLTVEDASPVSAGLAGDGTPVTIITFAGKAGEPGDAVQYADTTTARFRLPAGITTGGSASDTTVFVADTDNHVIRALTMSGEVLTIAGQTGIAGCDDGPLDSATFNQPTGLACIASGTAAQLYVADTGNHVIRKITLARDADTGALHYDQGAVTTLAGEPGLPGYANGIGPDALFNYPQGLWIPANKTGTLYVADTENHILREIDLTTGAVTLFAGKPAQPGSDDNDTDRLAASFDSPVSLATNGDATRIFIADTGNQTIRQISTRPNEKSVITIAGAPGNAGVRNGTGLASRFSSPVSISWVSYKDGGYLYLLDGAAHTVRQVTISNIAVTTIAGLAGTSGSADGKGDDARFFLPQAIVADSLTGVVRLHIADTGNATIRRTLPLPVITAVTSTPLWTVAGTTSIDGYSRQIVTPGTDVTFTVTATTFNPPLTYQWYLGGQPIAGATEPTISILNVRQNTAGIYTLHVTDINGTSTRNVSIGLTSGVDDGHSGFDGSYTGGSGGGAPSLWLLLGIALLAGLRARRK